jgi:hypothetical protein
VLLPDKLPGTSSWRCSRVAGVVHMPGTWTAPDREGRNRALSRRTVRKIFLLAV